MKRVGINRLSARPGCVGGSEYYFVRQLLGLGKLTHDFDVAAYVLPGFAKSNPELAGRPHEPQRVLARSPMERLSGAVRLKS